MPLFQEAEGIIVNGGKFVDKSNHVTNIGPDTRKREGIQILLNSYVQREAMHDSGARSALGCHPGTREEYIRNITSWGTGEWNSAKRAFLMTGPAGAGKSAIASTFASKLREADYLGASFFFYRPSGWNDPTKFIPTIAYQLATRYSAYRDCIDAVILDDPLVLEKEMSIQFLELLVKPLLQPSVNGHNVKAGLVIIVDGLDECESVDAQLQIINLVTTSVHEQTTPFLWAFFSRPEPPITSAFSSEFGTKVSWKLPLTLSGSADSDVDAYLRGSFDAIRAKYKISGEWPSENDIRRLVSQSAGLFVYPVTAIRYIGGLDKGTLGIEERLWAVLRVDPKSTDSPFSALDQLYRLVMEQIPERVLSNTLSLLYLHGFLPTQFALVHVLADLQNPVVTRCCFALGLSPAAFREAISNLYSVLEVRTSDGKSANFQFYHKSFLEFLDDKLRSKRYFIAQPAVHQHSLEKVVRTLGNKIDITDPEEFGKICFTLQAFFILAENDNEKLGENILRQISELDWSWFHLLDFVYIADFSRFIHQIPKQWRPRIIRPSRQGKGIFGILRQIPAVLKPGHYEGEVYYLGNGDKTGLAVRDFRRRAYRFAENI